MKTETLVKNIINEEPVKAKETIDVILKQKIADQFKKNVSQNKG